MSAPGELGARPGFELDRLQPVLFGLFFGGLLLWPLAGRAWALGVAGGAVVGAGLIPLVTGRYRTRMARLTGAGARARGLYSVAIGAGLIAIGQCGP